MTRRHEYFIREDLIRCYSQLAPDNLTCNGRLNKSQIRAKQSKINKELKFLFKEYGRVVLQDEVNSWTS